MTAEELNRRLVAREIVRLDASRWEGIREAFPERECHDTHLAGHIRIVEGSGGPVAVEEPSSRERVLRLLEPGGPVLVSFFAAACDDDHAAPFDHKVITAYQLSPATVSQQLEDVGFVDIELGTRSPFEFERPLDHATILARKPQG